MKKLYKKFSGWYFSDWAALDEEDTRKINYSTPFGIFSIDDEVDGQTMIKIKMSKISSLLLNNNEWSVKLYLPKIEVLN